MVTREDTGELFATMTNMVRLRFTNTLSLVGRAIRVYVSVFYDAPRWYLRVFGWFGGVGLAAYLASFYPCWCHASVLIVVAADRPPTFHHILAVVP